MTCDPNQDAIAQVELEVNGQKVELNDFVRNIVTQTITGMVKSLRGIKEVNQVDLKIVKKS